MPARAQEDAKIAAARRRRSRRRREEERESWTRDDFFRDLHKATRRAEDDDLKKK